ncbi:MAG: YHS domain-containing (seleno)protein, partial [Acidobacteriota bacterium]
MRDRYPHLPVVLAVLFVLSIAAVATVVAAVEPIYTGVFSQLAVGGYDPVSYFEHGEPVKGSKDHETTWRGATWRFASAEHLDRFVAEPEAYAPQYGG